MRAPPSNSPQEKISDSDDTTAGRQQDFKTLKSDFKAKVKRAFAGLRQPSAAFGGLRQPSPALVSDAGSPPQTPPEEKISDNDGKQAAGL